MADTNSPEQADQPGTTQSKTPPNSSTQPQVTGTPFARNRAGMEAHSSTDHDRQSNFESLRQDISGKIIGPMSTQDFLAQFIPSNAPVSVNPPSIVDLSQVKDASQETEMYQPFIEAFKGYVSPGPRFADSHTSSLSQWDGRVIAPDVVLLDNSLTTTWLERYPGVTTAFKSRPIESVGVMLEFKLDGETFDPFSDEDTVSFEIKPKDIKDPRAQTLGQICAYATAHMANQFRSHVFSVLVFREYARILRWDRAGVVVTEKINFNSSDAQPLAEFFHRYAHATPAQRGVDPFTERLNDSSTLLTATIKKQLDSDSKGPFYKFRFPSSSGAEKFYIVAAPQFMGTASPVGRSTRSFKAYDVQTGKYVFLKDTWRIVADSLVPEHERYATLHEAGVHHIPTVVDHHELSLQVTKTSLALLPGAKRGKSPNNFRKFQHYRLVLREYATPLEDFTDVKQLLTVVRDAMQAHCEAYEKGHILHRDISAGNIMIGPDGRGLLIDWDFSKSTAKMETTSGLPERTGTWQFIAYRLLRQSDKDTPIPVHDRNDDLESFWHVLNWMALRNCEHSATIHMIRHTLEHVYDGSLDRTQASPFKRSAIMSIPECNFFSPQLQNVMEDFRNCVSVRYIEESPEERISWIRKNWQEIQAERPNAKRQTLLPLLRERIEELPGFPRRYILFMEPIITTLELGWELSIFDKVLNPSSSFTVDWKTGCRNERRQGLDTRARSSLNKRKPDTQHTTVISGGSDVDDAGNLRNKKPRKESALQSVHEERE